TSNFVQWRSSACQRNIKAFKRWPSCLIFVGWSSETRKLGIKYCYNRPCGLYAARAPFFGSDAKREQKEISEEDLLVLNVTQGISSAFFPVFSPDGKHLLFLSARNSVDSGAHSATESLHRIDWPANLQISVVQCPEDGGFPGIYNGSFLRKPWLSDGTTIVLNSVWGSSEVILSVNVSSGDLTRISPSDSNAAWRALTLNDDNIIAVSSSPIDLPEIKYGYKEVQDDAWNWSSVRSPMIKCSARVKTPTIFLIGAQDLRVPQSNGIQYARSLKEKGVETKIMIFPNDVHGLEIPRTDYESFINIGVWFKKYCK
ncbi:unnamed protein product, partial [Linum tenue]